MQKLKVAIVGAGGISDSHAAGWLQSGLAEITGVVDIRIQAAEAKAAQWGVGSAAYASLAELLAVARPDIVDICTPEHVHAGPALAAVSAGIPVFSEKILASSLSDGLQMVEAASQSGVWNGINYNYHFFPSLRLLKEAVDSQRDGSLRFLCVNTHSFCFHHLLEAVLWLSGMPEMVSAQGTQRDWPDGFREKFRIADDMIYIPGPAMTARLEFPSGLVCSLAASYQQGLDFLPFSVNAVFESGRVFGISGLNWSGDMVGYAGWLPDGPNLAAEKWSQPERDNGLSFRQSIGSAAEALLAGGPPESTWESGWHGMLVDHGLWKSGVSGQPVDIRSLRQEVE